MDEVVVGTDFSGLGSFEEALKRLKVKHRIAFACDKDKYAKASYLANHNPEIFYDDIVLRDQAKTPYCDIYCFGFPCQAFSLAGNRKGFEDTRGTLFFNSLSYIKEKQPLAFIAENVKGLLSHDKGKTFGIIKNSLAVTVNGQHNLYKYKDCADYHLFYAILNSKNLGIPQNRERVFLIGFRNEVDQKYFKFPKSFKLKTTLRDLTEDEVDQKYFISEAAIQRIIRKGYSMPKINPEITGTINTTNNSSKLSFDSGTTLIISDRGNKGASHDNHIINLGYINQDTQASQIYSKDGIFPSICAGTYGYALGYISDEDKLIKLFDTENNSQGMRIYHENGIAITQKASGGGVGAKGGLYLIKDNIRRLTPKEVFRLMGYSDEFFTICQALNSDTQLYKQGGNSIVVDTMMWLLVEVCQALKIPFTMPDKN